MTFFSRDWISLGLDSASQLVKNTTDLRNLLGCTGDYLGKKFCLEQLQSGSFLLALDETAPETLWHSTA